MEEQLELPLEFDTVPGTPVVTVTKRYDWDMGHRLPDHGGKCRRLHGHRYTAEIDITGRVCTDGMVVDFGDLKQVLEQRIGAWDHRCMLHDKDQLMSNYKPEAQDLWGVFRVPFIPTAENIAVEVLRLLRVDFNVTRVRIYETPNGWAEVRA
ncbi:MAG: 6-carboxytetrahydropterin synthase [Candidatus Paceibacterota bacterium]|jgi:6-pyruvoyltetrahydropterin/6-carboxytetrahydropterin synthase